MSDVLQFAVLGLGAGASYTLLAHGVVLVYRGSGVVNLAHGALAMVGAYVCFLTLQEEAGWPLVPAFVAAVTATALLAAGFQLLVLGRLHDAAPIVRLVATLGLLVIVQAGVQLRYGDRSSRVEGFLPDRVYHWGDITVQQDRLLLAGIAAVLTVALWVALQRTRLGLAVTAAAEDERAVACLGWSPGALAVVTWSMGGALAGGAGIMLAPLTGLHPASFTLVVTLGGLAAALLGGFRSFPLTLAGGLLLGIGESLVTRYQDDIRNLLEMETLTGASRAVPFVVILLALVVRGRSLPLRSHVTDRLTRLGRGEVRPVGLAAAVVATMVGASLVFDASWWSALALSTTASIFVLSVVVLTGLAGQVSLGQYALGGIGALVAARLVADAGWPVEVAIVGALVAAVPASLVFALPALRTRGVNLAVVTLGLGITVQEVIFANPNLTGNPIDGGTPIGEVTLLGVDVNAVDHPERWAVVCVLFLVVVGLAVANLRRSRAGLRLVAVRTDERMAASLGISVVGAKLYAFGLSSAIAALAGVLLAFRHSTATYAQFNAFESINVMAYAVIGGLGYVLGAAFGGLLASEGLVSRLLEGTLSLEGWAALLGGVLLVVMVVAWPDGLADGARRLGAVLRRRAPTLRSRGTESAASGSGPPDAPGTIPLHSSPSPVPPVPPVTLTVDELTVRFDGVTALDGVSLSVGPGEVVGLVGANGAGKTTLIDAISGFVRPSRGSVALDGQSIDHLSPARRARRGLSRTFQTMELVDEISVADNVRLGADRGHASAVSWLTSLVRPGRETSLSPPAEAAVRALGLEAALVHLPPELPYGRRRLVGLARAIAGSPSLLLLDEPTAGLDRDEAAELALLVRRLATHRGMGILLIEHDVELVQSICERVVVLHAGREIAQGSPQEVRWDRAVRAAHLGGTVERAPHRSLQRNGADDPAATVGAGS